MKRFSHYLWSGLLVCAVAVFALVISCSDDSKTPVGPITDDLDAYITGIGPYPMPAAEFDRSLGPGPDTATEDESGEMVCTVERFEMGRNMHEIVAFDPNAGALWPGSIVQGKYIKDGILSPVSVARKPITVGIADMSGLSPSEMSRLITNPTQFNVAGALNAIVDTFLGRGLTQPAAFTFQSTETYAFEQGLLNLGIAVSWVSGQVRGQFGYQWSETKHTLLLKFTQKFYTATVDPPASPGAFFAASVTKADLANYTAADNPLCYVSAVTYGRIGILSMTSTLSESAMQAAVTAAFNDVKTKGTIDADAAYAQVLSQSEMKLLILGGSGTEGVVSLTDPVGGLMSWIDDGITLSGTTRGVPISYVVSHLCDNSNARFQFATEYSRRTCVWADQPVYVSVYQLRGEGEEWGVEPELEGWWTVYLYTDIPGMDRITKTTSGTFGNLGVGDEVYISSASWDNPMPRQAGAKFTLRINITEEDAFGIHDPMGDMSWDFTYPDFNPGTGLCSGEPQRCEFMQIFEKESQKIRVRFRVHLDGNP